MRLDPHPFTPADDNPSLCGAMADGLMCLLPSNAYEHSTRAIVDQAITSPRGHVDPDRLPLATLHQLLRAGAREDGTAAAEAAAEILIRHGSWLTGAEHADWRRQLLTFGQTEPEPHVTDCAHVLWRSAMTALDAGQFTGSRSAVQMLRIAASFGAGDTGGVWVCLAQQLPGLDYRSAQLIAQAVMHAAGWPGNVEAMAALGRLALADANDPDAAAVAVEDLAAAVDLADAAAHGLPDMRWTVDDWPAPALAELDPELAAQFLGEFWNPRGCWPRPGDFLATLWEAMQRAIGPNRLRMAAAFPREWAAAAAYQRDGGLAELEAAAERWRASVKLDRNVCAACGQAITRSPAAGAAGVPGPWLHAEGDPGGDAHMAQPANLVAPPPAAGEATDRLDRAAQLLGNPAAAAAGLSQADVAAEMVAAAEDVVEAGQADVGATD